MRSSPRFSLISVRFAVYSLITTAGFMPMDSASSSCDMNTLSLAAANFAPSTFTITPPRSVFILWFTIVVTEEEVTPCDATFLLLASRPLRGPLFACGPWSLLALRPSHRRRALGSNRLRRGIVLAHPRHRAG